MTKTFGFWRDIYTRLGVAVFLMIIIVDVLQSELHTARPIKSLDDVMDYESKVIMFVFMPLLVSITLVMVGAVRALTKVDALSWKRSNQLELGAHDGPTIHTELTGLGRKGAIPASRRRVPRLLICPTVHVLLCMVASLISISSAWGFVMWGYVRLIDFPFSILVEVTAMVVHSHFFLYSVFGTFWWYFLSVLFRFVYRKIGQRRSAALLAR